VDKAALEQVFSEYFGLLDQFSFHKVIHFSLILFTAGRRGHLRPKNQEILSRPTLRIKLKEQRRNIYGTL
jgi:hypothetical protein